MSSNSSSNGGNKLTFGQKTRAKKLITSKDLSEVEYHNLCLEVTKRVIQNKQDGDQQFSQVFSKTGKNQVPKLDIQTKREELITINETNRVADYSPVSNNLHPNITQQLFQDSPD